MPLFIFYHPLTAFSTPESKHALAKDITDLYSPPLPPFYVDVVFIKVEPDRFYVAGSPRPSSNSSANRPGPDTTVPFIRLAIEHIAQNPVVDVAKRYMKKIDVVLKPHIADKGYD
ncbi:putative oxalocrotonate tautomerase [Dendryphion nanum]|uniref:Oxalocrotonate tautomerase n=1 Tax=Dendryphion nanum TaxID=256645 RepID=A0A9P9E3W2_9PLEO|nr:putative oxalocrotonate tautomerase [Dendryphion nanum]